MDKEQPEALRLADWLDHRTMKMLQDLQASAELRRLYAVEQQRNELLMLAREFYNRTLADPFVKISTNTAAKRDSVWDAGQRLRDAIAKVEGGAA